jgi:hypothetical protein
MDVLLVAALLAFLVSAIWHAVLKSYPGALLALGLLLWCATTVDIKVG